MAEKITITGLLKSAAASWKRQCATGVPEPTRCATAPQFHPGDFRKENAVLLEQSEFYLYCEKLWLQEADEAENPERKMEAIALAAAFRSIYDKQRAFYSRWEISED